jgi:hypothetical protein
MPIIDVDFATWKAITILRSSETETEGDVVKRLLGCSEPPATGEVWASENVDFPVGTVLEHRFRDGRIVQAKVTARGIEYAGVLYSGLSPAGAAATGHSLNGWLFWFVRDDEGRLVAADALRKR